MLLQGACKSDGIFEAEVRSLLQAYDASELEPARIPAADDTPGLDRIGPYLVEREIGTGGMGAVYLASRADQHYEKKVAIKVVRSGAGTEALINRFFMERQNPGRDGASGCAGSKAARSATSVTARHRKERSTRAPTSPPWR